MDSSDELGCEKVIIPQTYSKENPPRVTTTLGGSGIVNLNVSSTVLNIIEINEIQSTFKLAFVLELNWMDKDLSYKFLNSNPQRNVINKKIKKKLWIPNVQFLSILGREERFETVRNFFIEKKGPARMENEQNESYSGAENVLIMETVNQASFICSFDNIKFYPFGIQECSFKIFIPGIDNKFTKLIPVNFIYDGPKSVGEYQVLKWTVHSGPVMTENQEKFEYYYTKVENYIGLTYSVHLSRKISNIILVTYLPTLLMNLINQATNYISSPDKYELIITVNITCMMVLASIYLAVSTSLPTSAEIKPVEVWLLFSLVYPVLVIVLNILIQVTN